MGTDKALLPIGAETALQRVVRLIRSAADPIVVVAGVDQQLPSLPETAILIRDAEPFAGPLTALAHGLERLQHRCELVTIVAVDQIGIVPELISYLQARLGDAAGVVVNSAGHRQPFGGLYRTAEAYAACRIASAHQMQSLQQWLDLLGVREIYADKGELPANFQLCFGAMNSPQDFRALLTLLHARDSRSAGEFLEL